MATLIEDRGTTTDATADQVSKVLDAFSALAIDLSCHCDVPPDTLILSAHRTRQACDAIKEGVAALKAILHISEAAGGGSIPAAIEDRLDDAENA